MKKFILISIACGCFAFYGIGQNVPPFKVKVLRDNTNLRARAGLNVEVAGQAAADQELTAKSMDAEWVEVAAPANVDFWVLGDYMKEGVVVCRQAVNVRVGPGLNFSVVGQLRNGDKVEVRGSHLDWIKIAPPETCSLWVSRPFVEIVTPETIASVKPQVARPAPVDQPVPSLPDVKPAENSAPRAAAKKTESSEAPKSPAVTGAMAVAGKEEAKMHDAGKPRPPEGLDLIPDISQGQVRQFEGTLKLKNFLVRSPSDYRLVITDPGGQPRTVCFVKGNRSQLKALLFRDLIITGRQYWVFRLRQPVVVPEKIIIK